MRDERHPVTHTPTHLGDRRTHATLKARLDALYTSFNCDFLSRGGPLPAPDAPLVGPQRAPQRGCRVGDPARPTPLRVDSVADPIQIVRRFSNPADREIVGFCAAALAFGRVASVLQSVERLLALMGPSPAAFVRQFSPRRQGATFKPLVHRWTRGEDLVALLIILKRMLARGSIEAFFLEGYDPAAADISEALESFSRRALAVDQREAYGDRKCHPGVAYFFPRPSSGSGCKRLNLFLRWMVRKDGVDFGLWPKVPAAKLIVPLDTHVIRVSRCLRLTRHTSPGWKMAANITASLRALDPGDPAKYDFSLCHIGMADLCGFNRAQGDSICPLRGLCHPRLT